MIGRLFCALAALALFGCDREPQPDAGANAPSPLLYQVEDDKGAVEGWLFGTIHALPVGTEWRTAVLDNVLAEADVLLVEIAALDDREEMTRIFSRLATSPGQPDLGLRVAPEDRPALFDLISKTSYDAADFTAIETWAAALILAQTAQGGDSGNGADRALIREFGSARTREFEGTAGQLGIFDQLPEKEQRDLLAAVIDEAGERDAKPATLRKAWLAGDVATLDAELSRGLLADPELREALLVGRNRAWMEQLEEVLASKERPLVAVGAAHLIGPDGLPAMLEERGYTVTRVQ